MSDSDFEDELLAVAGQGRKATRGKRRRDESDEDESFDEEDEEEWEDSDDDEEEKAPRKNRTPSKKAAPAREKPVAKRKAQLESESDDDDDFEINDDLEDLIEDEDDRRRLAAMPQVQREMVLFERGEKKRMEQERRRLLQQAGGDAEASAGDKDRKQRSRTQRKKASAASLEDDDEEEEGPPATRAIRSGREVREEQAKKSAMEELKAARERKARTTEEKNRRRESASEEYKGEDDEEEELSEEIGGQRDEEAEISDLDEEEEGGYGRRSRSRLDDEEEEEEASFEDLKSIQVRRHKLESWLNEPFFEATMTGCMVRLAMGERVGEDGMPRATYMLAQVMDVEERAPGVYNMRIGEHFEDTADSPHQAPGLGAALAQPLPLWAHKNKTSKWLRVARGYSERGMPLAQVSNQSITMGEFEAWQRACKDQRRPPISTQEVAEVRERLLKADNYTYTAEDVARVLAAKRAAGRGVHNAALEKVRMQRQRDAAAEAGNEEEAARLDALIAEMDVAIAASTADRRKHSMANINKRNANMNFQNAYQNVSNKVEGAFTAATKSSTLDPFSRRATRPQVYWNTKRGEEYGEEGEGGPAAGGAAAAAAAAEAAAATAAAARRRAKELEHVVDLSELDLSLLDAPSRMPQIARKLLGSRWSVATGLRNVPPGGAAAVSGKLLTMQDYKRRQGLA